MTGQNGYEAVIGLEVHAQLLTDSKIFCGCRSIYGAPPNSLTCPVCLGMPGSLPVLNKKAVEYAMRAIHATGGTVAGNSVFARKNYFYPDLPKGYQISQFDKPIGEGGKIEFTLSGGELKSCALIRIHLEEDAGKSIHPEQGEAFTRVDLNRCGTPLIEIVSEPELKSPDAAYGYLTSLKQTLQYLGVCSGDMEKGHLRCDANVSIRPVGQSSLGTRTELKNMNSFRGVKKALEFEINRQVELVKSGGKVTQATLLWNEDKQVAVQMRTKEESSDYRYFPDPDLIELVISDDWINSVKETLPELAGSKAARFVKEYSLSEYDVAILTNTRDLAEYFEQVIAGSVSPKAASNWITTELLSYLKEAKIELSDYQVTPASLADLLGRIESGEISGKIAKTVFAEMNKTGREAGEIIAEKGLAQISDSKELEAVIDTVLAENKSIADEYRAGKTKAIGFLVGQVMQKTKGQANPAMVNKILKEKL